MDVITAGRTPASNGLRPARFRKNSAPPRALFCRRPQALPGARPGLPRGRAVRDRPRPGAHPGAGGSRPGRGGDHAGRWPKSSPERAARRACSRCSRPRHRPGPAAGHGAAHPGAGSRAGPRQRRHAAAQRRAFGFDAVLLGPGCAAPFSAQGAARFDGRGRAACRSASAPTCPRRSARCAGRGDRLPGRRAVQGPPAGRRGHAVPRRGLRRHRQRGPGAERRRHRGVQRRRAHPDDRPGRSLNAGVAGSILLWHFRGV